MNLNKVTLIGRVTDNPQVRRTPSGESVASFSIATNSTYKKKDGTQIDEAEFHNIVVWGRLAELVGQYVEKAQIICVEGKIKTRKWETKEKEKRQTTEIIADNVQFGPRKGGVAEQKQEEKKTIGPGYMNKSDEELDSMFDDGGLMETQGGF